MNAPETAEELTADAGVIRTWLTFLYADHPGFVSVCSDADGWAGRRFATDEAGINAATQYAVQLDRRRATGVYAQTTTLRERPAEGRGGEDLAHALTHLWADGDYGTIGHKPGLDDLPAPPDVDAVVKVVTESGLPEPSGWINSGGGYNPIWMLAEAHVIDNGEDREQTKELTTGLQTILAAQAYRCGWSWDVEVGNLDRLMKLPGSINRKEGLERPAVIGPVTGDVFDLDGLRARIAELAPAAQATVQEAAAEKRERKAARTGRKTPPPRAPRAPRITTGDGPLDVLADVLAFRDILGPAGFTYQGQHNDGREEWLRPAAGGDRPSSAYSLLCSDHVAVNWSERSDLPVGAQPPGHKLTIGRLYAELHYGGDVSEAARDIMRATSGCATGHAAGLPHTVLAEVERRCHTDRHGFENLLPPQEPPTAEPPPWYAEAPEPQEPPDDPDAAPGGPARRRGLLPEEFWDARQVLRHIRQAAHARNRCGDIVLAGVLARLAAMLPPELKADTGVGAPASMNMFVILLGPSGSGKSSAAWIPNRLIDPPPRVDFLDGLPLGSGEGVAEAFMGEKTVETGETTLSGPNKGKAKTAVVRTQVRHNALFYADEGEALTKQLFGRSGATIGESIRRAWTSGTIGQFNGKQVNTRVVEGGSYCLGIVVGFQPETALPLLEDAAAGTPQRFHWATTREPNLPDVLVEDPGPLDLSLIKYGFGDRPKVTFALDILREIRQGDRERVTGEMVLPPLDSHKPLMLVKLAVLLAILANRTAVTVEDWQLAHMMWETSSAVRDAVLNYGTRQRAEEAEQRTRAHVDREVRAHEAKSRADQKVERVARRAAKRVHQAEGMTTGELRVAIAYRDRDLLGPALEYAESRGWIATEGDRLIPGDSEPTPER